MHGTDALEDQGPALRLTDLWQAQVGSQRGRPTRVGMLTVKMQWFERRVPGLTFGVNLIDSSAPVALGAASRKVLAAVPSAPYLTPKRGWNAHSAGTIGPSSGCDDRP